VVFTWNAPEWIVRDDKQQPHRYATLPALIHNATFLHLAKAAPGSPYQYLFASAPNAIGGYERDKVSAFDCLGRALLMPRTSRVLLRRMR
jgi:hypothetical protein